MIKTQHPHIITTFRGEYAFLSNLHVVPGRLITYKHMSAPSAEHLFQAAKCRYANEQYYILTATTPEEARRRGRRVTVRDDWSIIKVDVMRDIIRAKFTHPTLAQYLRSTGESRLVEVNHWGDTFWGIDARTGKGQNMLGKILESERAQLRMTHTVGA